MITLCPSCEKQFLAELAGEKGETIDGFYCLHTGAAAVAISQDGVPQFWQVSGPVAPEDAARLMRAFAEGLHGPLAPPSAPGGAEAHH